MKKYWILITASVLFITGLILNFTIGGMFSANEYNFNYFAAGDYAMGVFAAGKFSAGIFSIGIFSIGIFSISIFNIGLYTIGLFVIGYKKRLPKLFVGEISSALKGILKNDVSKIIVVFVLLGASVTANAQSQNVSLVGGFGGPMYQLSIGNEEVMRSTGGGGAAVLSNGIFFGGYGLGTSKNSNTKSNLSNYEIETEFGGLWLGYLKKFNNGFQISASLRNGWGEFKLVNYELSTTYFDKIHVLIPDVQLSKSIFGVACISIGVLYNCFMGVDLNNYTNSDLSGIGGSINLKFGFY